jgi:hypothetical protein
MTVDANIHIFVFHTVEPCGTTTTPLSTGLVSPPATRCSYILVSVVTG